MTIVMGLDQHRAQITAEWVDTDTGEVMRSRITPADRAGVRRFCEQFRGRELEVALEATTGWRFVADELRRVDAIVHLAEPAETAARRGNKKRAKSDRADAQHIRELLMIGRLLESWIPPDHLLDLRARVRLRHTLSHQRAEWQQRIQSVLYHHGCPQRSDLLTDAGRRWLAAQSLPAGAREQIMVALAVIDALECQLAPLDKELRAFARRQPGCRALLRQFGVGELIAVTILAELGDARRFSSSRDAVRFAGLDITVHQSDKRRAPGHLSRQGPPALRWALFEATMRAARRCSPDYEYYFQAAERLGSNRARLSVAHKDPQAQLSPVARTRGGGARPDMTRSVRAKLSVNQMRRGRLHARFCRHVRVDGPYRPSGRNAPTSGITRSTIMSPARSQPRSWTEIRPSARPHTIDTSNRAHAPPAGPGRSPHQRPGRAGCGGHPAQIRSVAAPLLSNVRQEAPPLMAGARRGGRTRGKSDPIDATAIARAALREGVQNLPTARLADPERQIRMLALDRERLLDMRTRLVNELRWQLHHLWPDFEIPAKALTQPGWQTKVASRLAHAEQTIQVTIARDLVRRARELSRATKDRYEKLAEPVKKVAPQLLAEPGIGVLPAAKFIGEITGTGRFTSDAQLARLAGCAPIPVSSGRSDHYRLDPGGNRRLNSAFYILAIIRTRDDPRTALYLAKQRSNGKTQKEAIRNLKRHPVRRIYHLLSGPQSVPTIICLTKRTHESRGVPRRRSAVPWLLLRIGGHTEQQSPRELSVGVFPAANVRSARMRNLAICQRPGNGSAASRPQIWRDSGHTPRTASGRAGPPAAGQAVTRPSSRRPTPDCQ